MTTIAFLQIIVDVGLVTGGLAYGWSKWRGGKSQAAIDEDTITNGTIKKLESAVHAREIEIADIGGEIKRLTAENEGQKRLIDQMLSNPVNLNLLTAMAENLEKLTKMMEVFIPLASPGGMIETFQKNHQEIMTDLDEIKEVVVTNKK